MTAPVAVVRWHTTAYSRPYSESYYSPNGLTLDGLPITDESAREDAERFGYLNVEIFHGADQINDALRHSAHRRDIAIALAAYLAPPWPTTNQVDAAVEWLVHEHGGVKPDGTVVALR